MLMKTDSQSFETLVEIYQRRADQSLEYWLPSASVNPVQLHQVLGLSALILIVSSVTAWWLNKRYWLRIHQSHTDELTGLPTYWQFKAH